MNDVMKNPCPDKLEAIEALAGGVDVDPEVREHLLECPGCNAYYRKQRRLEELIKETAGALDNPLLHGYRRPRKISPVRVAIASTALAAVLVAAVSAVVIFGPGSTPPVEEKTAPVASIDRVRTDTTAEQAPEPAPAPSPEESTLLATTSDEHVVQSFQGGLKLSLSGQGKATVHRMGARSYRVEIHDGLLVADVPETVPRTRLSVEADNIRVTVKGTLFSVRAHNRMITDVTVERGEVEVLSKVNSRSRIVRAGEALSVETLMVRTLDEQAPSLLAAFRVDEAPAATAGPAAERPKPAVKKQLTPYEEALALKAEGRYEEAVEAFIDASKTTKGLERERCLYQAASLSLSHLKDSQKAILLCKSYLGQYPGGFYAEDTYILQARSHMKAKEYEKARATLVSYIDGYPQGSQRSLAHLLLGKIFATTYGNCKAAKPHLEYVVADEESGPRVQQAQKILELCNKKLGKTP